MEAMARTFKQLWGSINSFKICHLGDHKVLFVFDNLPDVDRIIQSQPWRFDKHLVVLLRYKNDIPIRDLEFNKATFWVRVYDIPIRFMTRKGAEGLCEASGEVGKFAGVVNEEEENFICVRVTSDISLPFYCWRVVSLESGEKSWVNFKYEQLSNICY